jgi:hypothetical protein
MHAKNKKCKKKSNTLFRSAVVDAGKYKFTLVNYKGSNQ